MNNTVLVESPILIELLEEALQPVPAKVAVAVYLIRQHSQHAYFLYLQILVFEHHSLTIQLLKQDL